jgi:hypothetical protein
MNESYYYLVSGLPDLSLFESKDIPGFFDFTNDIQEQISAPDRELLKIIRFPFDNRNLITVLEKKNRQFDKRGNFTFEELSDAVKGRHELPHYMTEFIRSLESTSNQNCVCAEDSLNQLFYDEMAAHPNKFISEWFSFDSNLRNVLAVVNLKKSPEHLKDFTLQSVMVGYSETTEKILRSNTGDFNLSGEFPGAGKILPTNESLFESEKEIDMFRWKMLDELTVFSHFGIEHILAFCIKLTIIERWKNLDTVSGEKHLEELYDRLISGFNLQSGI